MEGGGVTTVECVEVTASETGSELIAENTETTQHKHTNSEKTQHTNRKETPHNQNTH